MDFDTLKMISNAVHFIGLPVAMVALWIDTLNGYFNARIPARYR
jgi:hypothetical protein